MAKIKDGRPTDYKEEYAELVYKLCLLGATDKQIADILDVTEATLNNWKKSHPDFFESLKEGKTIADANVAKSLYHRAVGYEHDEVITASFRGKITDTLTVTKKYPPDTAAAFIWMKNRQPKMWRDKQEIEHTGEITTNHRDLSKLTKDELKKAMEIARKLDADTNS